MDPNPSHGMEYAAYCEGAAAQLAGNSNIPTASTASHRQIAAHALGRSDMRADLVDYISNSAKTPIACVLRTQASLVAELDKLFAPPVAPSTSSAT